MEIQQNVNYKLNNIIRFRKKTPTSDLASAIEMLDDYIEINGAHRTGELIYATHVLYLETGGLDIEVIAPINKAIPSTDEFLFMSDFSLSNCIMVKYEGAPRLVLLAYTKIYHAIKRLHLEIEPVFYNVFKEKPISTYESHDCEIDVYAVVKRQQASKRRKLKLL